MSSIEETKKINFLKEKFPEKFIPKTVVEDADLLKKFGIVIKGKKYFPHAFLKLYPQDFIVEEIDTDEVTHSVSTDLLEKKGDGRYCAATLVKCGVSTLEAVQDIAQKLGVAIKEVSYAGVKDKKAITSQKIVVPAKYRTQLKEIVSDNYFIKDDYLTTQPLSPGNLKANKFTILLRTNDDVSGVEEHIKTIAQEGFKNFYYLQRFGSPRLLAPKQGYLIIKENFEKLIDVTLFERGQFETDYFADLRSNARQYVPNWSRVKEEFSEFPTILKTEHRLLEALIAHDGDVVKALTDISDQTQMWIYAFVSLLFNNLASALDKKSLPLCLSYNRKVHDLYNPVYNIIHIKSSDFQSVTRFPFIPIRDREVPLVLIPKIEIVKRIDGVGVLLQFTLPKGAYATTFLSHVFNLVSADENMSMNKDLINIREILGDTTFKSIFEKFKKIGLSEEVEVE